MIVDCFLIVFFGSPVLMPKTGCCRLFQISGCRGLSARYSALLPYCVVAMRFDVCNQGRVATRKEPPIQYLNRQGRVVADSSGICMYGPSVFCMYLGMLKYGRKMLCKVPQVGCWLLQPDSPTSVI